MLVLLAGCGGTHEEPAPVIRPQTGKELCQQACNKMSALGCQEGLPVIPPTDILMCDGGGCPPLVSCGLDGGDVACVSCGWFCSYQLDNGVNWNTSCLVGINSCEEIESVCNR